MLKKVARAIGIGLAAIIVVFVIVVSTRPSTSHYERSTTIAAPADVVFAQVNDLHAWEKWSPWDKLDPAMTRTYGGAPAGAGATYHWVGNDKVGEGRMTIEESKPSALVRIKLEFIKPFAATNTTRFTIAPEGAGVKVVWSMDGENNFMSKAAGLFMDMDKMIGSDFDKGLAGIKAIAEAAPKTVPAAAPAPAAAAASATP